MLEGDLEAELVDVELLGDGEVVGRQDGNGFLHDADSTLARERRRGIQGTHTGDAMLQLARRFSVRARIALVVALALLAGGTSPRAAAVPEKGTEILWDTYGIPHIFAPDHPSLFYAYGYAQMEGHAELLVRLYAQARGRGAEFYGDAYLASDRWVRTTGIPQKAKQWEAQQSA